MRGSANRHYEKRNALTLESNIHLIAEYRMMIHNASRRSQKAARYLYNASGLATSFNLFKTFLRLRIKSLFAYHFSNEMDSCSKQAIMNFIKL